MTLLRDRPYEQFNFLVDFGTGVGEGTDAGFQECTNLGLEVNDSEYNARKESDVRKFSDLNKSSEITLKRGVVHSLTLFEWLSDLRSDNQSAERTVVIKLRNEDHTAIVQTWKLLGARIIKHVGGPFNAKGTDVAMEELTLAYQRLEMD